MYFLYSVFDKSDFLKYHEHCPDHSWNPSILVAALLAATHTHTHTHIITHTHYHTHTDTNACNIHTITHTNKHTHRHQCMKHTQTECMYVCLGLVVQSMDNVCMQVERETHRERHDTHTHTHTLSHTYMHTFMKHTHT